MLHIKGDSSSIQIPQSSTKDDYNGPYDCIKSIEGFDHCLVVKLINIAGDLDEEGTSLPTAAGSKFESLGAHHHPPI